MKVITRLIERIPKAVRLFAVIEYTKLLQAAASQNTIEVWQQFIFYPFRIVVHSRQKEKLKISSTTKIK